MTFLSLDTAAGTPWRVRATAGPLPESHADLLDETGIAAVVPGEVHLDLMRSGLIPDPFVDDNEKILAWIGYCDWRYTTTFDWTEAAAGGLTRHDLVADGLDTAATIILNGHEVATTKNQHRGYRFDVSSLLVEGRNTLVVDLRSPIEFAREQEAIIGARPTVMHHPFNAIRKRASDFGWDWGIDVSSSGIWKSIGIESWSGVRIAGFRPLVEVDGTTGTLDAHVDLEWADGAQDARPLTVTVAGTSAEVSVAVGEPSANVRVAAGAVDLWWPRGYGAQPLYDVTATIGDARVDTRVGFRTVQLDTAPDAAGTPFRIVVNSETVHVKGANWIPDDAFVTRITPERYRSAITDAVDANMNLLRVWGGGMFESDDFYDVCDELGVLVWQDFLFACAAYSEEDHLRSEVEAEVRQNVTRLSSHPSLVLWNGCNENIWAYVEWGWRPALAGRTWGDGYYREILPALVAELDPSRPYSPGSPYSYVDYAHPNDPRNGTMHIWDVWNQLDYSEYDRYEPRFVSEFGFQGPPAWSTLSAVVHDEPMDPYGAQMLIHQKADEGNLKLERGLGDHLPAPVGMDQWHWATQLNQARALRSGISHFRSTYPHNLGTVVWQLNDNWPVVSWAAVDGNGIRKPLWHALRAVYADRLLLVRPADDGGLVLIAHNDSSEPWNSTVRVVRETLDGTTLADHGVDIDVEARGIVRITLPTEISEPGDARHEFVRATTAGTGPADHWFVEDPQLTLESGPSALTATVERTATGIDVTVTATTLVKDLVLQADRLHPAASVDSGLITLRAGESHRFVVTGDVETPTGPLAFPVLSSVNDLVG